MNKQNETADFKNIIGCFLFSYENRVISRVCANSAMKTPL